MAVSLLFVAVDEYNRQTATALKERLILDGQIVESTLKVDAFRRLEALLPASADFTLKQALASTSASNGAKISLQTRLDARKTLATVSEGIPPEVRSDVLFAVDHDGRVLAEVGPDSVAPIEKFELGAYAAVNDALHGRARDDVWMLGRKMYFVVTRPAEFEAGQGPIGALVGLKEVTKGLADDVARRTRTNLVFYASGGVVAGGVGVDGFESEGLKSAASDLKNVPESSYDERGHSDVRMLSDSFAAVYVRAGGDARAFGGGFAVVRSRNLLAGPIALLASAHRKHGTSVPWGSLVLAALLAAIVGILLSQVEQNATLRALLGQSQGLKSGSLDRFQLAPLHGHSRRLAQNVNDVIERLTARAVPARAAPSSVSTQRLPAVVSERGAAPKSETPKLPALASLDRAAGASRDVPSDDKLPTIVVTSDFAAVSASGKSRQYSPDELTMVGRDDKPALESIPPADDSTVVRQAPAEILSQAKRNDDTPAIAPTPEGLMAKSAGASAHPGDDAGEWSTLYQNFLSAKKECGQPSDGVTFEMFSDMLTKKRDALIGAHQCKNVRFSVAVTDGKVVMRAVPIRA